MEIFNFKMVVTPEQSRIVREFLFKNGYYWTYGNHACANINKKILCFNGTIMTWANSFGEISGDYEELTFKQFKEKYMKEEDFFEKAYSSLCKMQQAKNRNYGESALQPLDIFAKHHNYGARLDEKLARVKNCTELRKNDVADIIGGLMLICKDKGWDNFEDLID